MSVRGVRIVGASRLANGSARIQRRLGLSEHCGERNALIKPFEARGHHVRRAGDVSPIVSPFKNAPPKVFRLNLTF